MAQLGDIQLLDHSAGNDCGGAFLLARQCEVTETVRLADGWEVEVQVDNPYAVARGRGADDHNAAYLKSFEAVQQALDLLAIVNRGLNTVRDTSTECVVWWPHADKQLLRINSIGRLSATTGTPRVTISNPDGSIANVMPDIGQVTYNESMRFFRFSQLAGDVFDAYRNLWLAMETLLDYVSPKPTRTREADWIEQAFDKVLLQATSVHALNLPSAKTFVNDQYKDSRCRLFHAKQSVGQGQRPPLLPDRLEDRAYLRSRLVELAKIYREAVKVVFSVRAPIAHLFRSFLDDQTGWIEADNASIAFTSDANLLDPALHSIDPTLCSLVNLSTSLAPYHVAGMRGFIGSGDVSAPREPTRINSTILMLETEPILGHQLGTTLELAGVSTLEVFMALWTQQSNLPEFVYPDPPWLR